jgi:hypothetical protein
VDETQQNTVRLKHPHWPRLTPPMPASSRRRPRGQGRGDIVAAQARIRVAEANLAQSQATQTYLTIQAPRRHRDPPSGALRQGGRESASAARRRSPRQDSVLSPCEAGRRMSLGDAVTVEVPSPARPRAAVTAPASLRTPAADRRHDYHIDNADGRLSARPVATAKITLHQQKDALVLPAAPSSARGRRSATPDRREGSKHPSSASRSATSRGAAA